MSFFGSILEFIYSNRNDRQEIKNNDHDNNRLRNIEIRKTFVLKQLLLLPKVIGEIIMTYDHYYFEEKHEDMIIIRHYSEPIMYRFVAPLILYTTFIPDGRIVVASNTEIMVQNQETGKYDDIFKKNNSAAVIHSIAAFSEGLIVGDVNLLRMWNYKTNEWKNISFENVGTIVSFAKSISNDLIVFGSSDHKVRIWNRKTALASPTGRSTEQFEFILKGHTRNVSCVVVISDKYIVSGSWDKTIRVWDIKTGRCKYILSGHTEQINDIFVLSDEEPYSLVSCSKDKTIRKWTLQSDYYYQRILSRYEYEITKLAILPDKRIAGVVDGCLKLCNSEIHENNNYEITLSKSSISSITVLPDGRLVAGSYHGAINIWK
jgi:WD40 repeat protein